MTIARIIARFLGDGVGVTSAWAQSADTNAAAPDMTKSLMLNVPVLLAFVLLFYFMFVRPQKAQQTKHANFISELKKGDEVVTSGGVIGRVVGVTDRVITLEISEGYEMKILKGSIQAYLKDALPTPATV